MYVSYPPPLAVDSTITPQIPATSRLHPIHSPSEATTQGRSRVGPRENVSIDLTKSHIRLTSCHSQRTPAPPTVSSAFTPTTFIARLADWWPVHAGHVAPPIVDVP